MAWSDLFTTNRSYFPLYGTFVTFSSGGGSGALAYAVTSGGVIISVTIISGGTGYTSNPTPVFNGAGTGATGTAARTGTVVTSVAVTAGGTGYTTGAPLFLLNFVGNVWDALISAVATWIDNVNANGKTLSNLGALTLASGASLALTGLGNFLIATGKLGLNKSSPSAQIDINANVQPAVRVTGDSSHSAAIHLLDAAGTVHTWSLQVGVTSFVDGQCSLFYTDGTLSGHRLILYPDGSIGMPAMPTSNPGGGTKKLWVDTTDSNRVKYAV